MHKPTRWQRRHTTPDIPVIRAYSLSQYLLFGAATKASCGSLGGDRRYRLSAIDQASQLMCQLTSQLIRKRGCMQHVFLTLLLLAASQFASADDFKVIKLEQDVRNLERQVRELSRQVAELQRTPGRSGDQPMSPTDRQAPVIAGTSPWLEAKNWERVRIGMSEPQVIEILGPPTSQRSGADASSQTMFYALEIGPASFLGGQVKLEGQRVTHIEKPTLK